MSLNSNNAERLARLEDLIARKYEVIDLYRAGLVGANLTEKVPALMKIKDEVKELREYEKEYADLLGSVDPTKIPEQEARVLVNDLNSVATTIVAQPPTGADAKMIELLQQMLTKLSEPSPSAAAKLKVNLPIIPLIASYEMELDTGGAIRTAWGKVKELFKKVFLENPQ